jgi:hypothetical protein
MDNDIQLYIDGEKVSLVELIRTWRTVKAALHASTTGQFPASPAQNKKQEDLKEGELQW